MRDLYPASIFKKHRKFNMPLQMSIQPWVNDYIQKTLTGVREILGREAVEVIDMVIGGQKGDQVEVYRIELGNLHNALTSQHPEEAHPGWELPATPALRFHLVDRSGHSDGRGGQDVQRGDGGMVPCQPGRDADSRGTKHHTSDGSRETSEAPALHRNSDVKEKKASVNDKTQGSSTFP